jgi:hypothetical protein
MIDKSNLYKQYIFAGVVISFLQILDGLSFALGLDSNINTAYSWLELLWFLFSIVMLIMLLRSNLPVGAPVTFISYIIFNVAMATLVFEPSEVSPGYLIPLWFTFVTIGSALLFLFYLSKLYRHILG